MAGKKPVLLDLRPLQTNYRLRGIGRYTRELAKAIHAIYPVSALVSKSEQKIDLDIPALIVAPVWRRQWIWDMFVLPFHLWFRGVRLFHNFVALGPLDSISYPILFSGKCMVTVHDLHMFHPGADDLNKFYRSTWRIKLQKLFLGSVNKVITDAGSTMKEITDEFNIPPGNLDVIPLGCDHVNQWKHSVELTGSPEGIGNTQFILSIGDSYNKNLKLGMLILESLRKQHPELKWLICGSQPAITESLERDALPHWTRVQQPSDSELYQYYSSARLTLIPSTEEGFGIPVLEALKIGSPVVAGNIEVFREHLPEKSHLDPSDFTPASVGLWSDACDKLLRDEAFRKTAIAKGKLHCESFTWQAAAKKIIGFYP